MSIVLYEGDQRSESVASVRSLSELIIAIDFGTTFTGVAFSHTSTTTESSEDRDASRIAENVNVIKTWPFANQAYLEKTPTVIAYNTTPPTWGGSVRPQHKPQVANFKLGLESIVTEHYGYEELGNSLSSFGIHSELPEKRAVDFTADYLTCIHKFVHEKFLPNRYGEQFLQNQKISYILTVPAIWSDRAKDLTRQAAIRAGVPGDHLLLITEPEAAALFCATTFTEMDMNDGDRFLVCDAGGGTVDLIAYKIHSRYPFEIEECSVGTGKACGAVRLDEGFEAMLRRKLNKYARHILTDRRVADAKKHFDSLIKRNFNPLSDECEDTYEIPFAGASDVPAIKLEDGYLTLMKDDIQKIFDPIFNQILDLVVKQIESVKANGNAKIKVLFLVGGLGSNQYLIQFLQKKLGREIDIKQPLTGYSAIMRGAVLHGLGLNLIKERLMRRSYGVTSHPAFNPNEHPYGRRFVDIDGVERCKEAMDWYATKGQKMGNGAMVQRNFIVNYRPRVYRTPGPLPYISTLFVCEEDVPAKFRGQGVRKLCTVSVDMRKLPSGAFQRHDGSQGQYYQAKYDLGLTFGPELVFRFMYQVSTLKNWCAEDYVDWKRN